MAMGRFQELRKGLRAPGQDRRPESGRERAQSALVGRLNLKPWAGPGPTVAIHTRDLWSELPQPGVPKRDFTHRVDGDLPIDSACDAVSIWDGVIADPV